MCLESDAKIVAIRDTDVDNAIHVSGAAFDFKSVPAFFNTSVAIVHDSRTDELSAPKSTINASDAALRARADHHPGTTNTAFCDQERMIRSENANDSFKMLRSDNESFAKVSYADHLLIKNYEKLEFQTQFQSPPKINKYAAPNTVPMFNKYTVPTTVPMSNKYTAPNTVPMFNKYTVPNTVPMSNK